MQTQTIDPNPERSSRRPYVAAGAFFAILILVGVIALLPKLRHRDALSVEAQEMAGAPIVLATRHKPVPVFFGAASALSVQSLVAVAAGGSACRSTPARLRCQSDGATADAGAASDRTCVARRPHE